MDRLQATLLEFVPGVGVFSRPALVVLAGE